MSEDKTVQNNDDNVDDATTLKEKLEKVENEKIALEMKLRESDDDLYSDEYLTFLQEKKNKQNTQGSRAFGGRIADYTEEQMQEMANNNLPQLIKIVAGEVYTQIRSEDDREKTKGEMEAQKKRVAAARVEIKEFAANRPDFKEVAPTIKDLSDEHKRLNLTQLYILAGGKYPNGKKKDETTPDVKVKGRPDTKPKGEAGMKSSDKNLSIRDIIQEEYSKL